MRDAKGSKEGFFRFQGSKMKSKVKYGLAVEWVRGPDNTGHGRGP